MEGWRGVCGGSHVLGPSDVIETFMRVTEGMSVKELVKRWVAIALVGAIASRKVWTSTFWGLKLHANEFIMLVGDPGTGKSIPVRFAKKCAKAFEHVGDEGHVVFTTNITTPAAWLLRLAEMFDEDEAMGAEARVCKSHFCVLSEWASFTMDQESGQFWQALADLWDCPDDDDPFVKDTKEHGTNRAWNPYVNILAGVQPKWFSVGMPKGGWDMGFSARMLWVNCGEPRDKVLFTEEPEGEVGGIIAGLQRVRDRAGFVPWSDEARRALQAWVTAGGPPKPQEPMLGHYCRRRDMHVGKLALISVLSRGGGRIEMEDLDRAWRWLFELEEEMPQAIRLAGENPLAGPMELAVTYVREMGEALGGDVSEMALRRHLAHMVRPQDVGLLIQDLIHQGRLMVSRGADGGPTARMLKVGGGGG